MLPKVSLSYAAPFRIAYAQRTVITVHFLLLFIQLYIHTAVDSAMRLLAAQCKENLSHLRHRHCLSK